VAGASELFEERGFDRTTVDQIAEISRRTFFRYLAEDERLLGVLHDTLDAAPPGEPVLDLALQARRMAKTLRWGTGHRGPPRRAGLDRAGGAAGAQARPGRARRLAAHW
jgi:AcrR family transcriptional regulator